MSKCTKIPLATMYFVVKNIEAGRGIERQEGNGCLKKLNETNRRRLGQLGLVSSWSVLESLRLKRICEMK